MTELKTWVNKREIIIHCPACGKTEFFIPKCFVPIWEGWHRCRNCNLDIFMEEEYKIKMVMEEVFEE